MKTILITSTTNGTGSRNCCLARRATHETEALGRSKGGLTTKIHTALDGLGNPLRFILSPGQAADCTQAESLLAGFPAHYVMADKGYDSHKIVEAVADSGATVVIPSRPCVKKPRSTAFTLYG